jgi:single-strand DNA-binding protein
MNVWNGIGRLTKDIELKYSASNTAIANLTLAVDNPFGKEENNNKTFFINCVAFGKTAEFASKYFTKGTRIAVTGSIQTRSWEDTENKKHYTTEVVAEKVYFADGKTNTSSETKSNTSDEEEFVL